MEIIESQNVGNLLLFGGLNVFNDNALKQNPDEIHEDPTFISDQNLVLFLVGGMFFTTAYYKVLVIEALIEFIKSKQFRPSAPFFGGRNVHHITMLSRAKN